MLHSTDQTMDLMSKVETFWLQRVKVRTKTQLPLAHQLFYGINVCGGGVRFTSFQLARVQIQLFQL